MQQLVTLAQSQQQLFQAFGQHQQETAVCSQQRDAAMMQIMKDMRERGASEGSKDRNQFLNPKSGARPVV